jgi:hypothetical protein
MLELVTHVVHINLYCQNVCHKLGDRTGHAADTVIHYLLLCFKLIPLFVNLLHELLHDGKARNHAQPRHICIFLTR